MGVGGQGAAHYILIGPGDADDAPWQRDTDPSERRLIRDAVCLIRASSELQDEKQGNFRILQQSV